MLVSGEDGGLEGSYGEGVEGEVRGVCPAAEVEEDAAAGDAFLGCLLDAENFGWGGADYVVEVLGRLVRVIWKGGRGGGLRLDCCTIFDLLADFMRGNNGNTHWYVLVLLSVEYGLHCY